MQYDSIARWKILIERENAASEIETKYYVQWIGCSTLDGRNEKAVPLALFFLTFYKCSIFAITFTDRSISDWEKYWKKKARYQGGNDTIIWYDGNGDVMIVTVIAGAIQRYGLFIQSNHDLWPITFNLFQ